MSTIVRHILTGIIFTFIMSLMIAGTVFVAFPPDDWSLVFNKTLYDVPFLAYLAGLPVLAGIMIGTITALYWQQRLQHVERQLDDIAKGRKPPRDEPYTELKSVQKEIEQIQDRIRVQTENAQRLASERASEREKSLQEVVEQERNRLARELHDSVSQQLFAASMLMSAINETNPPEEASVQKQLQMVEKMIHQSQLEMRALLLHLRPVALKGKALQEGVEELLVELQQKVPLDIDWQIESFPLDKGVEDHVFRILQEAVSNTLRHAEAAALHVMLIARDHMVIMRVVDDGVGFDVEQSKTSSYGMETMRERALEIGGELKVVSLPDQGTRVEVKVPIWGKEGDTHD